MLHTSENTIIIINDSKYPKALKSIGDLPKKLYYKGNWNEDIFENCLAVVGSRRMTTYGKQITQKLVSQIASAGITIVSGFMYGIDGTAHQSCLDVGGKTIAVMPCGINKICPDYHDILYRDILENNGLIISEFEPDEVAQYWTFPRRNRIVAGLCKATLVIEAGEKSGSLITARLAKKYRRKVFAVPGPLTSILSKGTSQLIKNGAEMVTCAEDVINFYFQTKCSTPDDQHQRCLTSGEKHFSFQNSANVRKLGVEHRSVSHRALNISDLEDVILQELQQEPMGIDVLARKLKKPIPELSTAISMMQLKGLIKEENGKYYVK